MVAQLVRALACHARGRGFEPHPSRHSQKHLISTLSASVAQLVEQRTENPRVVGSIPTGGTICGFSSFGRASPCQGEGGGFEPRNPLQKRKHRFCGVSFFQMKGLERESVQSGLPVDVRDRGRPSAQFARESSPVIRSRKKHLRLQVLFSAKSADGGINPLCG